METTYLNADMCIAESRAQSVISLNAYSQTRDFDCCNF